MNSFSVTYPSTGRKEGKTKGKWATVRRGKTFVTVITAFQESEQKEKKKVSFKHDSENLQKPKPSRVAVFSMKNAPGVMHIKTNEQIEKEDLKASLAFLSKKKKRKVWKPSFLRTKKSTSK